MMLLLLSPFATVADEGRRIPAGDLARPDATSEIVEGSSLEFDCLLEPRRQLVLAAPVIGVVSRVLVDRGDSVEEGQLVATLESAIEEASVAMARARKEADAALRHSEIRLRFENKRTERNEQLRSEGVVSDGIFEEIESARLMAEASVRKAREDRDLRALELKQAGGRPGAT